MWWAWRVLGQLSNSAGLDLLLLVIPEVSFLHETRKENYFLWRALKNDICLLKDAMV